MTSSIPALLSSLLDGIGLSVSRETSFGTGFLALIDFGRVVEGKGIDILLTGLAIVFLGLTFLSLFIGALPAALGALDRFLERRAAAKQGNSRDRAEGRVSEKDAEDLETEIAIAVAMVLEQELEIADGSTRQRITLRRTPLDSMWAQAGHMRALGASFPVHMDHRR